MKREVKFQGRAKRQRRQFTRLFGREPESHEVQAIRSHSPRRVEPALCGCREKDHDICFDNIITYPDPDCDCCRFTIENQE